MHATCLFVAYYTHAESYKIKSTMHAFSKMQEARADRGAINITLNSFGGPLNEPSMRSTDRRRLYPAIGALYPEATNTFQVCVVSDRIVSCCKRRLFACKESIRDAAAERRVFVVAFRVALVSLFVVGCVVSCAVSSFFFALFDRVFCSHPENPTGTRGEMPLTTSPILQALVCVECSARNSRGGVDRRYHAEKEGRVSCLASDRSVGQS